MEIAPFRPAVRIVCVDSAAHILLLRWHDPYDGSYLWEPPGGGIERGESSLQAARRELTEETGLDVDAISGEPLDVHRDMRWNGSRRIGVEQFFLARFASESPALHRRGLMPDEQENLDRHAWVPWAELDALPDRLDPPTLLAVLARLDPGGPWARLSG